MKIKRSAKIIQQVSEATELRHKLLEQLNQYQIIHKSESVEIAQLVKTLEHSAEGYKLISKEIPVKDVDRKSSMLSGPFFSSAEHPSYLGRGTPYYSVGPAGNQSVGRQGLWRWPISILV